MQLPHFDDTSLIPTGPLKLPSGSRYTFVGGLAWRRLKERLDIVLPVLVDVVVPAVVKVWVAVSSLHSGYLCYQMLELCDGDVEMSIQALRASELPQHELPRVIDKAQRHNGAWVLV
jgi:hypothetical protein